MSSSSLKPPAAEPAATPLSSERLAEIAARTAAATPGPWTPRHEAYPFLVTQAPAGTPTEEIGGLMSTSLTGKPEADTIFVAHAREDVPALLAEVDRLRAQVAAVRAFATSHEYRWLHNLLDGGAR